MRPHRFQPDALGRCVTCLRGSGAQIHETSQQEDDHMDETTRIRMALEDIAKELRRIADATAPTKAPTEPHLAASELL